MSAEISVLMKPLIKTKKVKSAGWLILAILFAAALYIIYTSFIAKTS
jgi:hypothetical protein